MLDEERETLCAYDNIDKVWRVHSSIRTHVTKLTKLFGPPTSTTKNRKGEVVESSWVLQPQCVSFRKGAKRAISDSQRESARARLAVVRASIGNPLSVNSEKEAK